MSKGVSPQEMGRGSWGGAPRCAAVGGNNSGKVRLTAARLMLLGLAVVLAGCQPGIRWRLGPFDDGHNEARQNGQLTFVYFRNWYSVECTEFEEQVLRQAEVRAATADMVSIPLEYDIDQDLAAKWGLTRVPAFAIIDPAGSVYEVGSGDVTASELLDTIARAKQRFSPPTQPSDSP